MAWGQSVEDDFDLVIFNELTVEEIHSYLEVSKKSVFLAFTPTRLALAEEHQQKVNMANSAMTLYPRLMETLKYKELFRV